MGMSCVQCDSRSAYLQTRKWMLREERRLIRGHPTGSMHPAHLPHLSTAKLSCPHAGWPLRTSVSSAVDRG